MSGTLVVLTNYRRPVNVPLCLQAWRNQTAKPAKIVLVDNSPGEGPETYPSFSGADDVWRFRENLGPPCRFAPALALFGYRYVLFADDDFLPGKRAMEFLLETAAKVEDRFATIGQQGRNFRLGLPGQRYDSGQRYDWRSKPVRNDSGPVSCDITCNAHLVRADLLHHLLTFRLDLLAHAEDAKHLVAVHDDFLLCLGIQMGTAWPSLVVPVEKDPEQRLLKESLSEQGVAVWKRPEHFAERSRMVDLALAVGWQRCWG
jgi:hypothetical protein